MGLPLACSFTDIDCRQVQELPPNPPGYSDVVAVTPFFEACL
jgi:hypothetical protein